MGFYVHQPLRRWFVIENHGQVSILGLGQKPPLPALGGLVCRR